MANAIELTPGNSGSFPTSAGPAPTTVQADNLENAWGKLTIIAGAANEDVDLKPSDHATLARSWWGMPITNKNVGRTRVKVWTA